MKITKKLVDNWFFCVLINIIGVTNNCFLDEKKVLKKSSPFFIVLINLEDPISKYAENFKNIPLSILLDI